MKSIYAGMTVSPPKVGVPVSLRLIMVYKNVISSVAQHNHFYRQMAKFNATFIGWLHVIGIW